MIAYRATLDVPRELAQFVARLLWAERLRRGTRRNTRALTCFWQAVLALRWFRDRTCPDAPPPNAGGNPPAGPGPYTCTGPIRASPSCGRSGPVPLPPSMKKL